jgi:hydroxymethylbilane synthase
VKEIEDGLLNGEGDTAVHSLKDMPSELPPGLILTAVPEREDPHDALVLPAGAPPTEERDGLPVREGGRVGSSSLRRQAQLLHWRRDLTVESVRGNVDTRLRKLDAGEYDAILLAAAGLRRLGLESRISRRLPVDRFLPAVGQGALAIQARAEDAPTRALLAVLEHAPTRACVTAERAFLAALQGDCVTPLGAYATWVEGQLEISGMLADPEGRQVIRHTERGAAASAHELGARLAAAVLRAGGEHICAALRRRRDDRRNE